MRQEMTAAQKALAAYDVVAAGIMLAITPLAIASGAGRPGANTAVETIVDGAGLGSINLPVEAIFMLGTATALFSVRGLVATTGNLVDLVGRCGCFARKSDNQDLDAPLTFSNEATV